jgi:hypothetical protein
VFLVLKTVLISVGPANFGYNATYLYCGNDGYRTVANGIKLRSELFLAIIVRDCLSLHCGSGSKETYIIYCVSTFF